MKLQALRRGFAIVVCGFAVIAAASCGGDGTGSTPTATTTETPPPATLRPATTGNPATNLLINPGFEEGPEPWLTLAPESGFQVSQNRARSGKASALLHMDDPAEAEGAKVYYLVQEINPEDFPDVVRGSYFVENWQKGTPKQYLQFVVIAIGATNNPVAQTENYQLRYLLAGINGAPFEISNAKFLAFSTDEPITGQWVSFEASIKEDFQKQWGNVPEGYSKLRLLFEVRYDGKVVGDGAPRADVFYDDLYAGPR